MSAIEFHPERGEILVGTVAVPGRPVAGGSIIVGGSRIRPLTLAERDRLVHLAASDDDAVRRCALLVGDVAVTSDTAGADESNTADADESDAADEDPNAVAVQAVALQLAGASMSGPLAQSALLVARAIGPSVGEMAAIDADRLAAALVPATTDSVTTDSTMSDRGWTTIAYVDDQARDDDDGRDDGRGSASGVPAGLVAVRDELAAALVRRARDRLDPALVELLLGGNEPTDRSDPGDRLPPHLDDVASGIAGANTTAADVASAARSDTGFDRWAASPAAGFPTGAPDPEWPDGSSGIASTVPTETVVAGQAALGPPPPTRQPDRWSRATARTAHPATLASSGRPGAGATGTEPGAVRVPATEHAAPLPASEGRWGRLHQDRSLGAPASPGESLPVLGGLASAGPTPRTDRWSPLGTRWSDAGSPPAAGVIPGGRPARGVPDQRDASTIRADRASADQPMEALAHALHRTADVRGVPR